MKLRFCPKCGFKFNGETKCLNCGYTVPNTANYYDEKNISTDKTQENKKRFVVDHYFVDAGKFIIDKEKASIGMLQRTLKVGYNKAAEIMDELCEAGVVGKETGLKVRDVLMSMDDFNKLLDNVILKENVTTQSQNTVNENNSIDNMEGHDFENYCSVLLKNNGFDNVNVTKASGDQGIDIIGIKDGVKYGIQCKRYNSNVGNQAIQEAFSGAKFYDCHVPVVMTNNYFTTSAKELAQKNGVLLWDGDKLAELSQGTSNQKKLNEPTRSTHIIHITDKSKCKKIFEYFKTESLKYIEKYLLTEDSNEYTNQINQSVRSPLEFYSAKADFLVDAIHFVFYAHVKSDFYNTPAFHEMCKDNRKECEIIKIEVYYGFDEIYYNGDIIKVLKEPEVDALPSSREGLELLEGIDEWSVEQGREAPFNEESCYLYISA